MNPTGQAPAATSAPSGAPALDMNAIDRVILAGRKLMYSDQFKGMIMNDLQRNAPIDAILAGLIVSVMRLLNEKSGRKIPASAIAPAGVALCVNLATFARNAGMQIDGPTLKKAIVQTVLGLAKAFGVLDQLKAQQGGAAPAQAPAQPQPPAAAPAAPQGIVGG